MSQVKDQMADEHNPSGQPVTLSVEQPEEEIQLLEIQPSAEESQQSAEESQQSAEEVEPSVQQQNGQIRFDYDALLRLNSPNLSNLDLTLIGFFNTLQPYQITKEMRFHFPNKHNIHFNRRRVRPKAVISNDPIVLKKLRSCLSKISPQNIVSITKQITELLSGQNYDWKDVSEHFYVSAIEYIFMVDVFVQLMIQLNQTNHQLIHHLHHLIQDQVYRPRSFENTLSEEGKQKAKRWQISNGLLIIEIYLQKKYSRDYLIKILSHWMDSISEKELIPLEILIKVIPKLSESDLPQEMAGKLKAISQNKAYPTRLRLLLNLPKKGGR